MEMRNQESNGVFCADNVKKYWNNQRISSINAKFEDPYFPPNINSILAKDSKGNFLDPEAGAKNAPSMDATNLEWKRAADIFGGQYLLFDEKIEFNDIKQGNLGNCYFLSAIAAMAEFPQMIYQIFRTKKLNDKGYYEVVLFIDGEWQVVFVDDYFPVKKGTTDLNFARPNGNELWVILLEKVWAKVNGGYVNIISGWPSDPLAALTGFATEKLVHKNLKEDKLWETLKLSDNNDYIMCTSTKNDKTIESYGLVANHAYTLVGAKESTLNGDVIKLVHIRNPWGRVEWNGKWCDGSSLWTPDLNAYFNHSDKDDGTFFMEFSDFKNLYEITHVCHSMYDSNVKNFKIENSNINKPHVFNLALQENTRIAISIINKHWRYNRNLKNINHPFTFIIAKYNPKTKEFSNVEGKFFGFDSYEYVNILSKGLYAIWIYCLYEHSQTPTLSEYFVRFISPVKYRVKLENYDSNFECIKELIISGVKQKFADKISQTKIYYGCENSFDETGIGYRCIINRSDTTYEKWTNDATKLENMVMLPPYNGRNTFEFFVPPRGYAICLGMRTQHLGTYWFNLQSTYATGTWTAGIDLSNVKNVNIEDYISTDVFMDDLNDNYYTYVSSSHLNVTKSLQFEHVDSNEAALKNLMSSHPEIIKQIQSLKVIHNEESLSWSKLHLETGYYIGQHLPDKTLHGRGAYQSNSDGITYVGYWEGNSRERYGKLLNSKFQLIYEGPYSKGKKHGKGKYYFANGDYYEGDFEFDKRTGRGKYIWSDGSSWNGPFNNGVMHGIGIYDPNDGSEPWEVEYINGQAQ